MKDLFDEYSRDGFGKPVDFTPKKAEGEQSNMLLTELQKEIR